MACRALDDQVAVPTDKELKSLLEKFVCVRIVQMHGIDLKRFAFDGSLTWAVFMMNADGTIYGRYGSRSGLEQFSDREISVAGFKKSLSGALELHAQYGADKLKIGKQLAGKTRADKPSWPTPEAIPSLQATPRLVKRFTGAKGQHGGCIHCHMVPANEIKSMRLAKREIHDRELVPYPMPNQLGFRMDPKQAATVQRTWPDSRADRAGLKVGDRILRIDQQPILSTADIQWLLHNAENRDSLAIEVERGDKTQTLTLELENGWRRKLGEWRFINKGVLFQLLGFNVDRMPPKRAKRLGLGGKLALTVDRTSRETRMSTGLGNKNLIVAIDGKREPMTLGAFTAYVLSKNKGEKITVRIMMISDRVSRPEHDVEVTIK